MVLDLEKDEKKKQLVAKDRKKKETGGTPREEFKDSLKGKPYDDQQQMLSPDTSPIVPSNENDAGVPGLDDPTTLPEISDDPLSGVVPADNELVPPGQVLASTGSVVKSGASKPAVQKSKTIKAGYKKPALPTKVKKWTKDGKKDKYKTTGYEYRKHKNIVGGQALFVAGGKAAQQTKQDPNAGIDFTDPKQNMLEECYLVAAMSAIAKTHPDVIKNAIKPKVSGKKTQYDVTIHVKNQKVYDKHIVTVDPQPLYAKVKGTRGKGAKAQGLHFIQISKGSSPVAEQNLFLPTGYKPTNKGVINKGTGYWFDASVGGAMYRLAADNTNKADLQSTQTAAVTAVSKWPYTYKFDGHGVMRVGVESVSKDPGTGASINELWPVVLEKAIAHQMGGYQQLYSQRTAAQAATVFSMLTGKDSETTRLKGSEAAFKKQIIKYHKAKRPMIALCEKKNAKLGLEANHYFTITDITKMGTNDIMDVSLRDPRGEASKFGLNGLGDLTWSNFYKHFTWLVAGKV